MNGVGARRAAAVLLGLAAAAAAGCRGAGPRVPAGVTLVRPAEPPPPPALVEEAQRRLQRRGWYVGPIDGELTAATRVALAKLQRERNLPPTGRLDEPTLDALGLAAPVPPAAHAPEGRAPGEAPESVPAPRLRVAAGPARPQPPAGALEAAREEARRILQGGAVAAEPLPAPDAFAGTLAPPAARMAEAGDALAGARARAFDVLLRARVDGGWALLPAPLIERLEDALAARSLLVHGPDGRLDADDEAAIRWVERSVGLPSTGEPGLRLLEALGIDPTPMFEP